MRPNLIILNFQRELKTRHRYQDDYSPRPGPPPVLPESAFTTISANYYYLRDARRDSAPPQLITPGKDTTLIEDSKAKNATPPVPKASGGVRPGKLYDWDRVE